MKLSSALDLARAQRRSVLTTIKQDGHPQLSNVFHLVGDQGVVRISITADRAKHANLVRQPWAALHVTTPDFWTWAVIEGDVELTPVATGPDEAAVDALVDYYRDASGEHPDWDDYRRAMVAERRVLMQITPNHAYGRALG